MADEKQSVASQDERSDAPLVLDAAALAVWRCGAGDDARPILAQVVVRDGKVMAANGYIAAVADGPPASTVTTGDTIAGPPQVMIPRRFARYLANRLKRKRGAFSLARFTWLTQRGLTWIDRDMVMAAELGQDDPEGTFPDVHTFIAKEYEKAAVATFHTSPELTRNAIDTIADFLADDPGDGPCIAWRITGPNSALLMTAKRGDGREITVILMPMLKGAS